MCMMDNILVYGRTSEEHDGHLTKVIHKLRQAGLSLNREKYQTFVGTLHCALENGADLYVNERQKIRDYRARSTEEKSNSPSPKSSSWDRLLTDLELDLTWKS